MDDERHTFVFDFRVVFESDLRNAPLIAFRHMRAAGQRMMNLGPVPFEGHQDGLPGTAAHRLMAPKGNPSFPYADVLEGYVDDVMPWWTRVECVLRSPMFGDKNHVRRQSMQSTTTAVLVVDDRMGFYRAVNIATLPATLQMACDMGNMLASLIGRDYKMLRILAEPSFEEEGESPWAKNTSRP